MGEALGSFPEHRATLLSAGGPEAQWLLFKIDSWKAQAGWREAELFPSKIPGTSWERTEYKAEVETLPPDAPPFPIQI